jgi:hypothetical protein
VIPPVADEKPVPADDWAFDGCSEGCSDEDTPDGCLEEGIYVT